MSDMNLQELVSRKRNEVCAICGAVSSEGICSRCEKAVEEQERITDMMEIGDYVDTLIDAKREEQA